MGLIVQSIEFNWAIVCDGVQTVTSCCTHVVGQNGVTDIREHPAVGEGDRWFYDVHFEDGRMERIYNPNHIFYKSE